jgi:hypothetical protein
MLYRSLAGALVFTAALVMTIADAGAFDETKYPKFEGQWKRKLGTVNSWDESKRPGLPQDPPLTPEYRKLWEASMADQKEGGQGLDTRVTCISNGMPRMMTILRQLEIFIMPWVTLVVYENNLPRRIYTDGRDFTAEDNVPSYAGYSIGKWLDTDNDGRFDTLEVETRNFKGPRNYEQSGIPLHPDGGSIIKERLTLDKADKNTMINEITVIDNALTRPWSVHKKYSREKAEFPLWPEDICPEGNGIVRIGMENYFLSGEGHLMPTRKGQEPPDLRYFKRPQ